MAIQSAFYFTDGTTRTFPSTKHIASSANVAVWMKRVVDDVWELTSYELWTLANNSIVFTVAPQSTVYSQIELRVADESDELTESPSNIALVAGSIANVDTVATNISAVNTVSTNITAVQNTSSNATNINTVSTNIANVNAVGPDITKVNTVATNITNVNAVCSNIANVNTTATNIADINNVVTQVIPNLSEILLADDNATIATNKALEASGSATIATNKALEASGSATTATNKALEASNSATTATTKALEASNSATTATTKAGEALTSATQALGYRNEAEAFSISNVFIVYTIEDLVTIPSNYTTAIVKDPNRGGTFIWSATGTADGGTVFAGATGYWARQFSGAVNVKWFGAKGDGITDDTIAIQKAIDSISSGSILIPNGVFLLDTITYIDPTHIYATRGQSIFGFLFLKSNISITGESKESIIKVANGQLTKTFTYSADSNSGTYPNYNMPGTKGFQVFVQKPSDDSIDNLSIKEITFDLNGYNNKVYPINSHGNQSSCHAIYIRKGDNIEISHNFFKNSSGHQVISCDISCKTVKIYNNSFIDCGLLDGTNTNLTDHSTIYSMASDSHILNNCLEQTLIWEHLAGGCPIEVHNKANVKNNYIYQYASCGVLAALTVDSEINCIDNVYKNIAILGFDLYCTNSHTLTINIENNEVTILRRNISNTHPAYNHRNFIVSPSIGYYNGDVIVTLSNNHVKMTGSLLWNTSLVDKYNYIIQSNLIKVLNIHNNIFDGFRGSIVQLELQAISSALILKGNEFLSCGSIDGFVANNSVINYVNNNQLDYGNTLAAFNASSNKFYSCLYSSYFCFNININGNPLSPATINIDNDFTDTWFTTIYNNSGVDLQDYTGKQWNFNYGCTSVMTSNEILKVLSSSVNNINKTQYGNITINKSGLIYKYNSMVGVPSWKCEFISYGATVPIAGEASPFGSIDGDKKWIINPVAGGYIGYVCTSAGNPGTWKTFGAISV